MIAYSTSRPVLVLGMHRSGTSAITRLTGGLGATLPADPNPPAPDNIAGYWEPAGIVGLNDRLLAAADSSWLDTRELDLERVPRGELEQFRMNIASALETSFGRSRCFVLKDPRICRMVPFYRDLLAAGGAELKVIVVLRHPAAVAASLHHRNQISPLYSDLLWAHHLLEAERSTRHTPRVVADYDETLLDWRITAQRITDLLAGDRRALEGIDAQALPRRELRHHVESSATRFETPLSAFVRRLYEVLLLLRLDDAPAVHGILDRARLELVELERRLTDVITAERCVHRLTSPYHAAAPLDPARVRLELAAAFSRIQESCMIDGVGKDAGKPA
jgi:hypothetical protein